MTNVWYVNKMIYNKNYLILFSKLNENLNDIEIIFVKFDFD